MYLTTNKCDGQGDCIRNCPSEAIRFVDNKAFSCMCCGACFEACPNHAIFKNKYGGYVVDRAKCNGCGVWEFTCPIESIHIDNGIVKGICSRCGVCEDVCTRNARVDTDNLVLDKQKVLLNSLKMVANTVGFGAGVKKIESMKLPVKSDKTADRICVSTDLEKCVKCGRCAYYCPTRAIEVIIQDEGYCVGCKVCEDICPTGALKDGEYDKSICTLCLACVENCINDALSVKDFRIIRTKKDDSLYSNGEGTIVSCLNCGLCKETFDSPALIRKETALRYDPSLDEDTDENKQKRLEAIYACPVSSLTESEDNKLFGYCVSCGKCVNECNEDARNFQTITWDGEVSDDCISCGICAELCPEEAITLRKGAINVDLDKCIMCETCGIHCPTDAIPKATSVKYEISGGFNYIDENLCVKCGLCKDICPEEAIYTLDIPTDEVNLGTKNKNLRFAVDDEKCIYCGACMNICPSKSFIFEREFERVN